VSDTITLRPIGRIRSELADVDVAPKQGDEGAPEAWIDYDPVLAPGFSDLAPGDDVIIVPAVSDEEARQKYPEGFKTIKPYLRTVKQPG